MLESISIIVNATRLWETHCRKDSARLIPRSSLHFPHMHLLNSLERRFGRYAIPGILGYIVFFQCLVFAVMLVNPAFAGKLVLVPFDTMNGEWWRLLSFMIVPRAASPIMFIFGVMIMLMFMHRIESGFGAFRMNLFIILFMVTQWVAAGLASATGLFTPLPRLLYDNLMFVFAVMEPRASILLFGIIPLTARIIALVDAGLLVFMVLKQPDSGPSVLLALIPFLCFGIPIFIRHCRHRSKVGINRTRFKANSLTVADSFHRCSVCGRTDTSDPDLDFRITEDGIEYCSDHLPGK